MFTLQYRFARDVLPLVEPMVGSGGSVRAIDNHLLVTATSDRLSQIETLLSQLDVARKNIRITVSHAADSAEQQSGAGVSARGRIGDVEVATSRRARNGVNVDLHESSKASSNTGSEFLTVVDGERAFIRVGQSIPYTQQWVLFTQRYVQLQQAVEFQEITTGFAVRPRYIGDQVELEITPRISRLNQAGYIDFEDLSTLVRVSPGEWFDLGGNMQNKDEVSKEILNTHRRSGSQNTSLKIRVD